MYETREEMENARNCITHGAVSLDGGILRKNGMISLGFRYSKLFLTPYEHACMVVNIQGSYATHV